MQNDIKRAAGLNERIKNVRLMFVLVRNYYLPMLYRSRVSGICLELLKL